MMDERKRLLDVQPADHPVAEIAPGRSRLATDASARMGNLMEQVARLAPQESTVLLQGETGTGKTRMAALIHQLSPRKDEPFLTINCGSLSASLVESEMFGHIKGAFTGADVARIGKFQAVGSGTLFLDEVDSLPLSLQAKLLRAVEERVFEPVGSNRSLPMMARLIAASNQGLEAEVAARRFRADLFYRLNVVTLGLPPLREQVNTIVPLAQAFLVEYARRSHRDVIGFTDDALAALQAYSWPGNVRELRNVIERAVVLSEESTIHLDDLPQTILATAPASFHAPFSVPLHLHEPTTNPAKGAAAYPLSLSKEEAEKSRISQALHRHKNNRLRAAAELGISRMTLYNKLHKYGLMSG